MRIKSILLLVLGLVLIWLSGRMHQPMHQLRWGGAEPDEVQWDEDTDPTVKLVTVMLGPFRGVIADVMWVRASRLQEEGKYFELVQLADIITKLEPRFPEVWDYHGWNMAYNVSVYFDEPEERWRWVQNGLTLLRDEGLKYNPSNPKIHDSLSWMFQHKLGMNSDDAHRYYKQEWFKQMGELIPQGQLARVDLPEVVLADDAPNPYKVDEYREMLDAGTISTNVFRLVTEYKFRPRVMKIVDEKYGPFDWRLVQAHSLYWAAMGLQYSGKKDHAREQLHRRISQSMMQGFHRGIPIRLPQSGFIHYFPNLDAVGSVVDAYNEALEDIPDQKTFGHGRRNFFRSAIPTLYIFGREAEARTYYDMMRQLHPRDESNQPYPPFEEFVKGLNEKEIETLNALEAFNLAVGSLVKAKRLGALNPIEAAQHQAFALKIYEGYSSRIQSERQAGRIGIGTWEEMAWAADMWIRNTAPAIPLRPEE